MSKVVSLAAYKKRKEEEEIERLQLELSNLISELDVVPEPYYVSLDMTSLPTASFGVANKLAPTLADCVFELRHVSWILGSLGHKQASEDIDNIIKKLQ